MKRLFIAIVSTVMLLSSCSSVKESSDNGKLKVYTSFYAMYDFAKTIGGDKAEVHLLCSPAQEPHDFEPTAQDMAKLSQADVFIYNGMGMEHWAEKVADTLPDDVTVIEASSVVKTDNPDPHVWLHPKNAYKEMKAMADVFMEKDRENKSYYKARLNEAKQACDDLYYHLHTIRDMFQKHTIIVSHDAYSHLCDLLKITQMPVNGRDNSGEPTPQRVAEIEQYIKDNDIKYIFCEPMGTSDVMDTIAKDTGCEVLTLDPFEGSADGKDYVTAMCYNIDALTKALN